PLSHVRDWQAVSEPGQSCACKHSTQLPAPSQNCPPDVQAVPAVTGGWLGVPLEQRSFVHSLPSTGGSAASLIRPTPPIPSQACGWESPAVWAAVGVPSATKAIPHVPSTHVRDWQSVSVPGQSFAVMHSRGGGGGGDGGTGGPGGGGTGGEEGGETGGD